MYIQPSKLIRLRFRYKLPTGQVKVLVYTLEVSRVDSNALTVYDFLQSVFEDLLSPILLLQNENVIWLTVSITYPLKKDRRHDLLKLPLTDIKGLVKSNTDNYNLRVLNLTVRFTGKPLPLINKIYGVDVEFKNFGNDLLDKCCDIYNGTHRFNNSSGVYSLVFLSNENLKYKNKTSVIRNRPVMTFANIY